METINFGEPKASQENVQENNSAPKAPMNDGNKRKRKLIWAGIFVTALILAVLGWQYWQYTHSMYYQQMQGIKNLEKMAQESDKWGGKTPEETVSLFRDAVQKGDFELASKYGNRDQVLPVLEKMKAEGKIDQLIKWLGAGEVKMFIDGNNADLIIKEDGKELWILSMGKSGKGTWKIDEF